MKREIIKFSLAWRWTQQTHNVFPDSVLDQLKPLDAEAASQLNEHFAPYFDDFCINQEIFPFIKSVDKEDLFPSFLDSLEIKDTASVYLSWDANTALKTTWGIFRQYWNDFCYPSSDDVIISPEDETWLLSYSHANIFEFGKQKNK